LDIVLLPGLDGTGLLFKPFLDVIPTGFEARVIPLVQNKALSSREQAEYVMEQIGTRPCVLVAESYSGLIAYELVRNHSTGVKHIIFVASFLSRPSHVSTVGAFFPIDLIKNTMIPKNVVGRTIFGSWRSNALTNLFLQSVRSVDGEILKSRIKEISAINEPADALPVPCSYIQATHDWFVSGKALQNFERLRTDLSVHVVEGTHFLLQTNPAECWRVVHEVTLSQSAQL